MNEKEIKESTLEFLNQLVKSIEDSERVINCRFTSTPGSENVYDYMVNCDAHVSTVDIKLAWIKRKPKAMQVNIKFTGITDDDADEKIKQIEAYALSIGAYSYVGIIEEDEDIED